VNFPEQIQKLNSGDFINAGFSANLITTFDLSTTISQVPFSGGRGVHGLGNGNLLATNGNGVHEVDPATGAILTTIVPGVSGRFIQRVELPMGATPTPTQPPTATPTEIPTVTPTETPVGTSTPIPPIPATGSFGILIILIALGALISVSVTRRQ